LEAEIFGTVSRNDAFDEVIADFHDDVSHNIADLNVLDRTRELISS